MNIFNPEHDLCLANDSPNFVPPESALEFGRNCEGLTHWIQEAGRDEIIPWGWDPYLKRHLRKQGTPDTLLPSDGALENIREFSHRRTAIEVRKCLDIALRQWDRCITRPASVEMTTTEEIASAIENLESVVLKAPWSGSGKGLRWVRRGEFYHSDEGWCRRTIARQGSVIVEKRFEVVQDFAMLFRIGDDAVNFEGWSLFHSENGMYRGNLLASNEFIIDDLCRYIPEGLLTDIKDYLSIFLRQKFSGKYTGYLGVDMFIANDDSGRILVNPCVEINVRMTMGLLARKAFDRLRNILGDGTHSLSVEYRPNKGEIVNFVNGIDAYPLHEISEENRYAVIITKNHTE